MFEFMFTSYVCNCQCWFIIHSYLRIIFSKGIHSKKKRKGRRKGKNHKKLKIIFLVNEQWFANVAAHQNHLRAMKNSDS